MITFSENGEKLKNCDNVVLNSRFSILEKELDKLFNQELLSSDSIFVSIQPNVTKKIAMFLSGLTYRPAAIGVCGETASGKSTIVQDSIGVICDYAKEFSTKNIVTCLTTDDYYYDRSKEVKEAGSFAAFAKNYDLDVPEAIELSLMKEHIYQLLNKKMVKIPRYDMSGTAIRIDACVRAVPSPVIIAEGLYALNKEVADVFDFKIYVDIDKELQKKRFFERAKQRNLGSSAEKIFENASQKAQKYVHPCSENADIVLNGAVSRDKYKKFILSLMNIVEANYFTFAV